MNNDTFITLDEFIEIKHQEMNESNYDWEVIALGLGIVASTINEDNNNEVVYNYFEEELINECIDVLNENIDELEEEQLAYCIEYFNEYLNEMYGVTGAIGGGVATNKILQKSQDKKIQALRDQGASDTEIAKMQKKHGRMRKLATLGGIVGGAMLGGTVKDAINDRKKRYASVASAKQEYDTAKNQAKVDKKVNKFKVKTANIKNENYDWEAIALGLGIVASTVNEDNNHNIVYEHFEENIINDCIDVLNENIDELEEEQLAYCIGCFNDYLNEEVNIVDVAPEKRKKHTEKEEEKEENRKCVNAKLQPHSERNRVNCK